MIINDTIDNFVKLYLNKLGISDTTFSIVISLIFLYYFIRKVKKIDNNETFFKILFSEKYDEDFGGYVAPKLKGRHQTIIFIICLSILLIFSVILSLYNFFSM